MLKAPPVRGWKVQSFCRANPDTNGSFYLNAHFPSILLQYPVEAVDQRLETTILHPILLITLHMSDTMNLLIANLPEEINAQIANVRCSSTSLQVAATRNLLDLRWRSIGQSIFFHKICRTRSLYCLSSVSLTSRRVDDQALSTGV